MSKKREKLVRVEKCSESKESSVMLKSFCKFITQDNPG